jgi:uncharacterized membrane protein YhaH (DUF805 family)
MYESEYDKEESTMISKEKPSSSAIVLACAALLAVLAGLWVTRPANMDQRESIVATVVIYVIAAGAPLVLVFAAAITSARQGCRPSSGWWILADLVPILQLGAGATFVAGAIVHEERLAVPAVGALVAAAFLAVASGILVSRVSYEASGEVTGL